MKFIQGANNKIKIKKEEKDEFRGKYRPYCFT